MRRDSLQRLPFASPSGSSNVHVKTAALILVCSCLTGCVFVPVPHREWDAPRLSGRVLATDTRTPVTNALVTRIPWGGKTDTTHTDSLGVFRMPSQRGIHWWNLDRGVSGTLTIEHERFESGRTNYAKSIGERYANAEPEISVGDIPLKRKP